MVIASSRTIPPVSQTEADQLDVSVVLPCLNEEASVASCVTDALSYFENAGLRGEVIVVDNGSTDRSIEEAENAGARVLLKNAGVVTERRTCAASRSLVGNTS